MRERDCPFRLSITATDFYVYVRDKDFFVYVHGRKEERKEGRRKTGDNTCELPSKDFWRYVRDTDFSAYVEGRKKRENSCGLCITDTDFYLYINTNLLIHIWPIPFIFFFFSKALCLKVRVSCVVNYFPCMSSFCGEEASSVMFFSMLLTTLHIWSSNIHPCLDQWHNFMAVFHVWVKA